MEKGGIFLLRVSYSDLGSMYFSMIKPVQLDEVYDYISTNENIEEAVVLWTCNRFEIYFYPGSLDTVQFLDEFLKSKVGKYSVIHGEDAIKHLFLVASGLDSMIIGENEILGQVRDAWKYSQQKGYSKNNMNIVFRKAIEIGKKIRSTHGFNKIKRSVASESLQFVGNDDRVLLVGAGKLGKQIGELLSKRGIKFSISNRTESKAKQLAKLFRGDFIDFRKENWKNFDTIILAINAPKILLKEEDLRNLGAKTVIDLSTPPAVESYDGNDIRIITMEKLSNIAEINNKKRQELAREALKTVEDEFKKFILRINQKKKDEIIKKFMRYSDSVIENEILLFSKEVSEDYMGDIIQGLRATRNKLLAPIIEAIKASEDVRSSAFTEQLERVLDEQLSKHKDEKIKEIKGNSRNSF